MRKIWEDYRWIPATAVGSAVFALGFSLFLQPNEISPGGISGLALVAVELLGYGISFDGDNMHVVVPTWRSTGDVSIQADIMEEVARMYGYENFEAEPITTTFDGAINQLDKDLERKIKEYLAFRCGMQEIFTYPWMDELYVNAVLQSTDGILALSTPPSPAAVACAAMVSRF